MVKSLLTCLALAAAAHSLALPQEDNSGASPDTGSSLDGGAPEPELSWTTASCQDGALTRSNAPGADRWRDGKATSAWNYMRNVFFANEGTKPEDYQFTSMGISDFFHQGDGIRCGATGQDDTSCKSLQYKCEDLAGQPLPEDIMTGKYPAAFLILNSISNLNDASNLALPLAIRNLYIPLQTRLWDPYLSNMNQLVQTFTNGLDAQKTKNGALDALQLILFSTMNPFFNLVGDVPGVGIASNVIKDTAFAGVTYAISRAKDDFAATLKDGDDGNGMVAYMVNATVAGLKQFNEKVMAYVHPEAWPADTFAARYSWDESMDMLFNFIDEGRMLPNEFVWDSGFVDNFVKHMLVGATIPHLWRMASEDVKPAVLSTDLPCDAPWEDYGTGTGDNPLPYFVEGTQPGLSVCYKDKRYYLVAAVGKATQMTGGYQNQQGPPGPTIEVGRPFQDLKGADKLEEWGLSKEAIVESAVEGYRVFRTNEMDVQKYMSQGNWNNLWTILQSRDLGKAMRLPGIVGIPVCPVGVAQRTWKEDPDISTSPCNIMRILGGPISIAIP